MFIFAPLLDLGLTFSTILIFLNSSDFAGFAKTKFYCESSLGILDNFRCFWAACLCFEVVLRGIRELIVSYVL